MTFEIFPQKRNEFVGSFQMLIKPTKMIKIRKFLYVPTSTVTKVSKYAKNFARTSSTAKLCRFKGTWVTYRKMEIFILGKISFF
jgi:hypothetical protein